MKTITVDLSENAIQVGLFMRYMEQRFAIDDLDKEPLGDTRQRLAFINQEL